MNGQNSPPVGSAPSLQDDLTFNTIQDAFLLGWSLFELRSRVLIASVSASIDSPTQPPSSTDQNSKDTASTITQAKFTRHAGGLIDTLMGDVIQAIRSIPGHTQDSSDDSDNSPELPTDLTDNNWLTSVWRSMFKRIVTLHKSCIATNDTSNTVYNPPDDTQLPYLYPTAPVPDYADFGANSDPDLSNTFKLCETTRRALNCLTLLYTTPKDSLVPDIVQELQTQIVQSIAQTNQPDTEKFDRNKAIKVLSGHAVNFLMSWDGYMRENLYFDESLGNNQIKLIAYEAGRSLASLSWGASAVLAPLESALSPDPEDHEGLARLNNNIELTRQLHKTWKTVFSGRDIEYAQHQISALSTTLDDAYTRTSLYVQRVGAQDDSRQTNSALPSQSLHAIKHSLDYWKRAVKLICDATDQHLGNGSTPAATSSSDSPSPVGQVVPQNPGVTTTPTTTPSPNSSPVAASQPTTSQNPGPNGVPSTSPPVTNTIPALNWDVSSKLRQKLVAQAEIWQPLLLCQQTMQDFPGRHVTQRILQDCMSDFEEAAKIEILAPAQKEATSWVKRHPLIIIIPILLFVLIVVVVIILGVVLVNTGQLQGFLAFMSFLGGGLLALFTSLTGRASAFFFPPSEEPSTAEPAAATYEPTNMFERFSGVLGLAGSDFVKPFQTAYEQIRRDFNDLDHNVAVTFPLIEFFTQYSLQHAEESTSNSVASNIKEGTTTLIEDSYDFLKQVVWTKEEEEEEIRRVALAAFGPLGALVKAQVSSLEKGARNSNQAGKL